jgi:hypothetical protein
MPKICPLLLITVSQPGTLIADQERESARCLGEECTWYVKFEAPKKEGCAIRELSYSLKTISMNIPLLK